MRRRCPRGRADTLLCSLGVGCSLQGKPAGHHAQHGVQSRPLPERRQGTSWLQIVAQFFGNRLWVRNQGLRLRPIRPHFVFHLQRTEIENRRENLMAQQPSRRRFHPEIVFGNSVVFVLRLERISFRRCRAVGRLLSCALLLRSHIDDRILVEWHKRALAAQQQNAAPLQFVNQRTQPQKRHVPAERRLILRRRVARGHHIANRLHRAAPAPARRARDLDPVHQQPEKLIHPPALRVQRIERLRRDRFQQQLRIRIVVDRDELKGRVVLVNQSRRAPAIRDLNRPARRRHLSAAEKTALHAISARDLPQLEEICGIAVLQPRKVQQQFPVRCLRIRALIILEVGSHPSRPATAKSQRGQACHRKPRLRPGSRLPKGATNSHRITTHAHAHCGT